MEAIQILLKKRVVTIILELWKFKVSIPKIRKTCVIQLKMLGMQFMSIKISDGMHICGIIRLRLVDV